jgi:hypothetical protein
MLFPIPAITLGGATYWANQVALCLTDFIVLGSFFWRGDVPGILGHESRTYPASGKSDDFPVELDRPFSNANPFIAFQFKSRLNQLIGNPNLSFTAVGTRQGSGFKNTDTPEEFIDTHEPSNIHESRDAPSRFKYSSKKLLS